MTELASAPSPLPFSSPYSFQSPVIHHESKSTASLTGVQLPKSSKTLFNYDSSKASTEALSSHDSRGTTSTLAKSSKTSSPSSAKDSRVVNPTEGKSSQYLSFNESQGMTSTVAKSSNATKSNQSTEKDSRLATEITSTSSLNTIPQNNTKPSNQTTSTKSHDKKDRLKNFVKDITNEVFADPRHVVNTEEELEERLTEVLYEIFTKRSHHKENKTNENRSATATPPSKATTISITTAIPTSTVTMSTRSTTTEDASKRHLLSNSTVTSPVNGNRIPKSESEKSSSRSRPSQIKSRIDGGFSTTPASSKFKSKIETLKLHSPATPRFKKKRSKSRVKIRNTKGHLILGAIKYHDINNPTETSSDAIKYAATPGSNDKMPNILRLSFPNNVNNFGVLDRLVCD